MSSAPQIDHATVRELAKMLSNAKISRETEALRARLPAQLAPFASNISITKPIQTTSVSPRDGVYCRLCTVKEHKIFMSVAVVPSLHSQSQDSEEPHVKPLRLVWQDWETSSWSADSRMRSLSLRYGHPHPGMHSKAKAFTGWYDDPARSEAEFSHGGIKSVVEEVARDMGFREGELDNKLEVIEALLGLDGRQLLEDQIQDRTTLREIIEDELEEVGSDYWTVWTAQIMHPLTRQ